MRHYNCGKQIASKKSRKRHLKIKLLAKAKQLAQQKRQRRYNKWPADLPELPKPPMRVAISGQRDDA